MNVERVRQLIIEGQLAAADDIDARVLAWNGSADDGTGLLAELVAQEAITNFQAQAILAGVPGPYKLGPYQVFDKVAAGRLGSIFRAVHEEFDQPVALKVFRNALAADPSAATRVAREMRVAIQADHPNVLRTYQVGRISEIVFLAIEDLQGETLAARLERESRNLTPELPVSDSCHLIRDVAQGLGYLHAQGIVLRDIQPGNIWIGMNDRAKLMEFGAARDPLAFLDTEDDDAPSMLGDDLLGSYDYLAPEQGADVHNADERSDIYALGCVFFHCLTGQVVFPDDNPVRKMLRHAQEAAPVACELVREIPKPVSDVLASMLAKNPDERYQKADDIVWALEQVLDLEEEQAVVATDVDPGFLEWANSTEELSRTGKQAPTAAVAEPVLLEFLDWLYEQDDTHNEPSC